MVVRGAARKLTLEEEKSWTGPKFYINHLAVVNPKSKSTPIRIVFNSSHVHKGMSLNNCLAKGPDTFTNSGIGILLRWREEPIALVGDIRKMFHCVFLRPLEQHCHRFLWRGMDTNKEADIYVMQRVNMGVVLHQQLLQRPCTKQQSWVRNLLQMHQNLSRHLLM